MSDEVVFSDLPADISSIWRRIVAGDDWKESIYIYVDDEENPQDTTGWTMEIKVKTIDGEILKTLTTVSGIVNNPAAGRFDITYAAADTLLLQVQRVKLVVKITDDLAEVDTILESILDVYYP